MPSDRAQAAGTASRIPYSNSGLSAPCRAHEAKLLACVAEKVQAVQDTYDGSHDFAHIVRVARLLESLLEQTAPEAEAENSRKAGGSYEATKTAFTGTDVLVARLGILLHDVDDHKYAPKLGQDGDKTLTEGIIEATQQWEKEQARERGQELCLTPAIVERVKFLVRHVSYSKEQKFVREYSKEKFEEVILLKEPMLQYVQDADRLDALGALGVARCFAYGGSRARALYSEESLFELEKGCTRGDVSPGSERSEEEPRRLDVRAFLVPERVRKRADTLEDGVAHFYEKLFFLKDRLRTAAAREMAVKRHDFMADFLAQMREEVRGRR